MHQHLVNGLTLCLLLVITVAPSAFKSCILHRLWCPTHKQTTISIRLFRKTNHDGVKRSQCWDLNQESAPFRAFWK